jgi:predicted O-linked N-acetylglucosamine transferase (SPINDLY family)
VAVDSKLKEVTLGEALELAANHFRAGNLDTSLEVCTQILQAQPDNPDALHLTALIYAKRSNFDKGIEYLEKAIAAAPDNVELHNNLGNIYKAAQKFEQAQVQYDKALAIDANSFTAYYNIGTLREVQGKIKEAIEAYEKSLSINNDFALGHYNLANLFNAAGDLERAVSHYQKAVALDPNFAEANANLGTTQLQLNRLEEAIESYKKALKEQPNSPDLLNNLAIILTHSGKLDEAVKTFEEALKLKPDFTEALNNLGLLLRDTGKIKEGMQLFKKAVQIDPKYVDAINSMAESLIELKKYDEAIKWFKQSVALKKDQPQTLNWMAIALRELGYFDNAEKCFRTAQAMVPTNQMALLGICMINLREIFKKEEDVFFSRRKYLQVLEKIAPAPAFSDPRAMHDAALALGTMQPYLLAVHGQNDVEMQRIYGGMVSKVMTMRYADVAGPIRMPSLEDDGRIRIGIATNKFNDSPTWQLLINGWLKNIDRKRFKVFCYSTGGEKDAITEQARMLADVYHEDMGFEPLLRQMLNDRLHTLIYPEIGVDDAVALRGSALRLAAIQCVAWGHPETTGIGNIDYFLSSELMEPEQSEMHYTEKLVRLPNLGTCLAPPNIVPDDKNSKEWHLRPDDPKYLLSEPLYKYLPQHDKLFASIAKSVHDAQFVFLKYPEYSAKAFQERIEAEFTERRLNPERHLVFLPRPKTKEEFAALCAHCDFYLDAIGWSGAAASMQALEQGLPIVTWPGPIMRGRHAYALLKMSGLTDTIAEDLEQYVDIAVKLGRDDKFRKSVEDSIKEKKQRIFDDTKPIEALQDFIENLVKRS